MSKYVIAIAAMITLTALAGAHSESLWGPSSASMFEDLKARRVGDLLTIVIVEQMSSSVAEDSDYDKSFEHNNAAGVGPWPIGAIPDISFSSSQNGAASGSNTVSSSFQTKVTATVTCVLPNGNMQVQATRQVITNKEKQDVVLTGVVRPADVSQDNTILSTYIADMKVEFNGTGPIGNRQKEGLISKILRYIF